MRGEEVDVSEGANPPPGRRRRKVGDAKPAPGEDRREEIAARSPTLVAREGDSLHVRFPEVTLPLRAKYASAKVGGLSMTRTLRDGEDVAEAGREMASALRELSLEIARETIRDFDGELAAARESR